MFTRFLTIGSAVITLVAAFGTFATSAEANFYYDESYYNQPIPCYQYDGAGHCVVNGNRYRVRTSSTYQNRNYNTGGYYNSGYYNGSTYSNRYPYSTVNYSTSGTYRPVGNYYRSSQINGCYWYYGSYRCDSGCNH